MKLPRAGWRAALGAVAVLAGGLLGAAALAPLGWLEDGSREELFEIPKGTYARRAAGNAVEILPDTIRLTLGVKDVLLLRNADEVPQVFGPALIMPGQSFRLPFELASTYSFACTAHASGQMSVIVDPAPSGPRQVLNWRVRRLLQRGR